MKRLLGIGLIFIVIAMANGSARTEQAVTSDDYRNTAIALATIVRCLTPEKTDPKYYSDAVYVVGLLQSRLDEQRLKQYFGPTNQLIEDMGAKEFCRRVQPNLDRVITHFRKEYPDALDRAFDNTRKENR